MQDYRHVVDFLTTYDRNARWAASLQSHRLHYDPIVEKSGHQSAVRIDCIADAYSTTQPPAAFSRILLPKCHTQGSLNRFGLRGRDDFGTNQFTLGDESRNFTGKVSWVSQQVGIPMNMWQLFSNPNWDEKWKNHVVSPRTNPYAAALQIAVRIDNPQDKHASNNFHSHKDLESRY